MWRLQDTKNAVITSGKLARGQSASVYQTEQVPPLLSCWKAYINTPEQDKEVFLSIKLDNFEWSKRLLVTNTSPDAELIIADPATKHTLHVRMSNAVDLHGTRQISLYTACWMLNKVR